MKEGAWSRIRGQSCPIEFHLAIHLAFFTVKLELFCQERGSYRDGEHFAGDFALPGLSCPRH